jgi:hypothetical protein
MLTCIPRPSVEFKRYQDNFAVLERKISLGLQLINTKKYKQKFNELDKQLDPRDTKLTSEDAESSLLKLQSRVAKLKENNSIIEHAVLSGEPSENMLDEFRAELIVNRFLKTQDAIHRWLHILDVMYFDESLAHIKSNNHE